MLKLENFSRNYGVKEVLKNIFLELKEHEVICILGPNGAGKTTLLEGILSHHRYKKSKIYYYGKELRTIEEHYEFLIDVSYLGHEPGLFYDISLIENLRYILNLYKFKKKDLKSWDEVMFLIEKIGLYYRKNEPIRNFSRGMKQRAGLLRCMITNPKIFLFDEPMTGLDTDGKKFLIECIQSHKNQSSFIIVSHDDEVFNSVVDRYIFINHGEIIANISKDRYNADVKKKIHDLLFLA